MTDDDLRHKLEQLHNEIEKVDHVDAKGRALLSDIDGHIRVLMARSDEPGLRPRTTMRSGLEDAMRHFEVTHPALTEALADLLTALSNAGI
jgi:hypothetical protein